MEEDCTTLQVPQPFHESHPANIDVWEDSTGTLYITGNDPADEWMYADTPSEVNP